MRQEDGGLKAGAWETAGLKALGSQLGQLGERTLRRGEKLVPREV